MSGLPWTKDGIDATEERVLWSIVDIAAGGGKGPDIALGMASLPWLRDGFSPQEADAVVAIGLLAGAGGKGQDLAQTLVGLPWPESPTLAHVRAIYYLDSLLRSSAPAAYPLAQLIASQPWFRDGMDKEEAWLVAAVSSALIWEERQRGVPPKSIPSHVQNILKDKVFLLATIPVRRGSVDLTVFYMRAEAGDLAVKVAKAGLPVLESLLGDYPYEHLTITAGLVFDPVVWGQFRWQSYGGSGDVFASPAAADAGSVYLHEIAHAWWVSPGWFAEGTAVLASTYALGAVFQVLPVWARPADTLESLYQGATSRLSAQGLLDVPLVRTDEVSDNFSRFPYDQGFRLVMDLYRALGVSNMRAAYEELYAISQQGPIAEKDIEEVFLKHTPPPYKGSVATLLSDRLWEKERR